MRHLTAIALLLAISAPLPAEEDAQNAPGSLDQAFTALQSEADQPQQYQPVEADMDVEVVEVFTAENDEALEAALADGYPPPWLAEILEDESIPEEDRYWLDCRVRAVIAQDLHTFFDREGNPVHYDADWIAPGEEYWRECFLVNPPGDVPRAENGPSPTSNVDMDPGLVVDRFGDEIGEIPFCNFSVLLSRDGRIGVTPTGGVGTRRRSNQCYACFQFPDSGFVEVPIDVIDGYDCALSADGSRSVFTCRFAQTSDRDYMAWVFDGSGELLWKVELPIRPLPGPSAPAVSPDGSVIAIGLTIDSSDPEDQGGVLLLDGDTGEEIGFIDHLMGHTIRFTPNGRYLCVSGISGAAVFSLADLSIEEVWTISRSDRMETADTKYFHLICDRALSACAAFVRDRTGVHQPPVDFGYEVISRLDGLLLRSEDRMKPDVSPGGVFVVAQTYTIIGHCLDRFHSLPLSVFKMQGGE